MNYTCGVCGGGTRAKVRLLPLFCHADTLVHMMHNSAMFIFFLQMCAIASSSANNNILVCSICIGTQVLKRELNENALCTIEQYMDSRFLSCENIVRIHIANVKQIDINVLGLINDFPWEFKITD